MIITNNVDFAKYLQSKFVPVYLSDRNDVGGDNDLYIIFNNCRNSSICGNRFNKKRLQDGTMKQDFYDLLKYFEVKNLIMITPVTHFGGKLMADNYPVLQGWYNTAINNGVVTKQRIHSSKLGEINLPRYLSIYYKNVQQLQEVTNKQVSAPMIVMNGKNQRKLDYDVICSTRDKDERHKLRYYPEYAVFSQIYHQIIEGGLY